MIVVTSLESLETSFKMKVFDLSICFVMQQSGGNEGTRGIKKDSLIYFFKVSNSGV